LSFLLGAIGERVKPLVTYSVNSLEYIDNFYKRNKTAKRITCILFQEAKSLQEVEGSLKGG
jgi:hypothetical protein